MKIVNSREPEKRAQSLHNKRIAGSPFVDYVHGCLVVTMYNNALVGP